MKFVVVKSMVCSTDASVCCTFIYRVGDQLPDRLMTHLPSSLTQRAVYERMKEEMSGVTSCVSLPQFYNLWKDYYPHVSIPSVSEVMVQPSC